jgi:hypothetical protein
MSKIGIALIFLIVVVHSQVQNCQIPNPDGTCYQCDTGYNSISGGGCAEADPNC